jgi:hypothetical protein
VEIAVDNVILPAAAQVKELVAPEKWIWLATKSDNGLLAKVEIYQELRLVRWALKSCVGRTTHKDRGVNSAMLKRAKDARVEIMMLTVDSITGGESGTWFAHWVFNTVQVDTRGNVAVRNQAHVGIKYATHGRFKLPQLDEHVDMSGGALSIGPYLTEMLDQSMNWDDVGEKARQWNGLVSRVTPVHTAMRNRIDLSRRTSCYRLESADWGEHRRQERITQIAAAPFVRWWHFASLHGNAAFWSLFGAKRTSTARQEWPDRSGMTQAVWKLYAV